MPRAHHPRLTWISVCLLLVCAPVWGKPGGGNGGGGESGSVPHLSFAAEPAEVEAGERVLLSWASSDTRHCFASGDWEGKYDPAGFYETPALDGPKSYTLQCKNGGNSVTATVAVAVVLPAPAEPPPEPVDPEPDPAPAPDPAPEPEPEPAPAPKVALAAADGVVESGGSTRLDWTSTDTETCTASGGWSGVKSTSGSEAVGPLDRAVTFGLSCTGAGGSAMELISVAVNGTIALSWQAPTQNVDGTPLTDLAAYHVYYGPESGAYTGHVRIESPAATSHALTLPSGSYYFAMTALDVEGNESVHSNEVIKVVE